MKTKYQTFFVAILVLSLTFSGCQTKKSIIIENSVCLPPCWQNIQPGTTSSDEVFRLLKDSLYLTSQPSENPIIIDGTKSYDSFVFANNVEESSARIYYINNIVEIMEFSENGNITFGKTIDFYGQPDLISVISGWGDSKWLKVSLLYLTKGVLITHYDNNWRSSSDIVNVSRRMNVDDIYYFNPDLYKEFLYSDFFGTATKAIIDQSIHPWTGFTSLPITEQ